MNNYEKISCSGLGVLPGQGVIHGPNHWFSEIAPGLSRRPIRDASLLLMELIKQATSRFTDWMNATGFAEIVGGPAVVEAGFAQVRN